MKILHTADWHIGQFKGPVVDGVNLRSQDTVKCLEYMVQVAIEEKPDIVCVSGDIFHQEQVGPVRYSDEMITATNIITSLAHFSKYVIVMRGTPNHDGAAQFRVLERMLLNIRNVDVVTEPGVIKTPWADIACLPGFDKQEFRAKFPGLSADEENLAWTKYISDMVFALRAECEKTPILMAHYTVPGCNMESGQTSFFTNFEPVIPREALMAARYEAVLLGHIHRPQIIEGFDNVFYSGAINAMNFNDEGQDRGFWIHEFNEKGTLVKGHRYTTPYRQFHTITWDPDEVGDYIREGAMYLHRTGISEDVTDKIVRVRYSCTSEQKKALNIPLLQKNLYELGAFYVADIEAESTIDITNRGLLSEESDPRLNLKKWLEEKTFKNPDKIVELAEPIIAEAMKQSTTAEIHGVFKPVSISVRNYRNYKEESFDFSDISFCTINGVNGAGKSSLFMDAIVDCLFEETREGDCKAWIRGTEDARSGSIEFIFDIGEKRFRVVRTRTKSGKPTLNLSQYQEESADWMNLSKERIIDTQAEIEKLLGMDSMTFRSCALIMQDQYGLFLQAKKDERIAILGNLLGLIKKFAVMDNLRSSLGGLSETEKTAAASTIFGKEAMSGMLAIINASEEDYNNLSSAIGNSKDAAQDMADTMLDNLAGSMTLMQSAVEGVQNSFGQRLTPYVRGFVDSITDAMPAVTVALNDFMDTVDKKAAHMKTVIGTMTASDEWQNADMFGKMDIAWDTLIGQPFADWIGGDGKHLISSGLGTLFSSASAILPGGKKAGLSSVLSSMLIAKGATGLLGNAKNIATTLQPIGNAIKSIGLAAQTAPSVGAFISDLGAMVPTAAKFGLAAAAVTAAVVGIGVAVDNYNQKALSSNLEEHFGNIKLSAQEVQDIASGILDQKYLANVEVALNEVKNADKLREDAQKALESNDVLEFKSRVGIKLTTEEQEDYTSNIETFVKSKIEELESRTFAAHIHVQTYLGGTEEGQTLAQNIEKWATADYVELDGLSSQLSQKVSEALKDGIIDADEEGAISALQEKMNSITARWKESEAQAQWDWINQEYGSLNAADLESGSFTDLLGAMRDQRQSAKESVQADVEQWYSELNSMESAGRITSAQNKQYHEMTGWYVKGQEGNELSKSLQLGSNTLNSAYAEKIQSNRQSLAENTQYTINTAQSQLEQLLQLEHPEEGNVSALTSALMYGFNEFGNGKVAGVGPVIDKDQNALSTMYESMKPDVTQMQGLIDDYREAGKAVPQSLMDSFNDAIEVGAAAGDTSATWQNYANQIWKNGSDELKASLTDPSNPMYETVRSQLPPELAEAIDRAAAETTTDDVTLEGLKASVDGDVDIDKDAWTSKLNEALGDLGETQEVTADHVKIKVDQGDCLWEIGNALGIDWQTIAEQNGIESPYVIHPDQELTISMDTLTAEVDGDKAQAAIEQAMSALDAEGAEMSVTAEGVKVDLADVEVDSDTAAAQIEAALGMESGTLAANGIEVQAGASVTIPSELVTVDTSGMQSATEQAADETETEPIEQEASANVNVTNTTTDTSGMQAQAEEDAQGAVGDVPVEGSANVTFSGTTTDTSGVVEQVTADIESAVSDVPANGHASITLDQSNNAAEIYSLATADVVSAFSETIPADGHVDVTLDQTNNAAAIYSECAGQVQSTFAQGFTASADVAVTLNWHITNPSASISTSSSGSSVSATIAGHASGGEVGLNGAELSWVGEEGLEYIIPTVPARRQRGIELWKSAGRTLGVLGPDDEISAHASGGIVGKEVSNTTPYFDTDSSSQDSEKSEKETVPTNVVSDKSGVVVQVNLSPQFNISDTNDSDVIRLIKAHIKELADDLGSEIATMLSEAYENTPVTT